MIDINSKSYPYLAIAQNYVVDYGVVLAYSNICKDIKIPPYTEWRVKVWELERDKK